MLIITHCADTAYDHNVTADDIDMWHRCAKTVSKTHTIFLGKRMSKERVKKLNIILPSGKTCPALFLNGNGWSRSGYSDFIDRDGVLHNMNPYDFDGIVDTWEITFGASGVNNNALHICLAGGRPNKNIKPDSNGFYKPYQIYTPQMLDKYEAHLRMLIQMFGNKIEAITGHYEYSDYKTCPNFDVKKFCNDRGIKF